MNMPLMQGNILREDVDALISFLQNTDRFTQGGEVRAFEREWSEWLGVKYSVFVNSGASANFMTMGALRELHGPCEVIVPTLAWTSDVASVLIWGHTPIFVDIDMATLSMDIDKILQTVTPRTKAVFLTHVLGYNGLSQKLLDFLKERDILLLEDVCESHGATFWGKRLGSFGKASNFSFYYAHHMSTIEGGMVCTDDPVWYRTLRMLRSHGMLRECGDEDYRESVLRDYPQLNPEFVFTMPAFNMRSTELNAVIGRSQLGRLDSAVAARAENLRFFLAQLDRERFFTDFNVEGNSNYAFTVVLRKPDSETFSRLVAALDANGIEYRRGLAGGGNLTRQPYVQKACPGVNPKAYPNTEHVHFYGMYLGNYPGLTKEQILQMCTVINQA